MVKPGSIIGGIIVAISLAMQVITLVEIARFYWLLFIWFAGLVAGAMYVAGGLDFGPNKMEFFTTSGVGFGAIIGLTVYFWVFQWNAIAGTLTPLVSGNDGWVIGAICFSTGAAILVAISTLFIAAGAGRQLKDVKPGAIIGGILISLSLALQVIVVIHFKKAYWLLVFWFVGLIGAIALAAGARAKGYGSTESFVIAGIGIGILAILVIWWAVSPTMRDAMDNTKANVNSPPTHELSAVLSTVIAFISGLIAFFGVTLVAASDTRRSF